MTDPVSLPDRIADAINTAENMGTRLTTSPYLDVQWLARQVLRAAEVDRRELQRQRPHAERSPLPEAFLGDLADRYGVPT